jgi:chromosome segregation ATPase
MSTFYKDGTLYVSAESAQEAMRDAAREDYESFRAELVRQRTDLEKRIDALRRESNAFNEKWCAAEERCGRLDRAEEAMREYEATIGNQRREIVVLQAAIDELKRQRDAKRRRVTKVGT